jgi:hypothetical protein
MIRTLWALAPLVLCSSPALAQQAPTAAGGYGAPTPSGIPSYGDSSYYPTNSGGARANYTGLGGAYLGTPDNPITGSNGRGTMGYGQGSGYGSNVVSPPAAGGYGLPDVVNRPIGGSNVASPPAAGGHGLPDVINGPIGGGTDEAGASRGRSLQPIRGPRASPSLAAAAPPTGPPTAMPWTGPLLPGLRYQAARQVPSR